MSNNRLKQLLVAASSGGGQQREAEQQLTQFQQQNAVEYIFGLCTELNDAKNSPNVRHFAGILLGHAMQGESAEDVQRGWETYDANVQNHIKSQVMTALGSPEKTARKSAALVIAKIAAVEFTNNQWQDLVPTLLEKIASSENAELSASLILCLKYLCEEAGDPMTRHTGTLLEALKYCFSKNEPQLMTAVFECLSSILGLLRNEVQQHAKRNDIMFMLCTAAGYQPDPKPRALGFQSLGTMVSLYYDHMEDYISAIFDLTKNAIERTLREAEQEEVGQQAIEFWSYCADEEARLLENLADPGRMESRVCRKFIERSVQGLVPMYLEFLKRQNEELDDETWTISKSAACSLEAFAKVSGPLVLQHVGKFMEENIVRNDWRSKEAAMCAFGFCINDTTTAIIVDPLQTVYRDFIPRFLKDDDPKIRRTTAWTLGKVCKHVPSSIPDIGQCLAMLGAAVNDVNAVAHYACWCIAQLAEYCGGKQNDPISEQAQVIIQVLIGRSIRTDSSPRVVRSVHEAINNIIMCCDLNTELVMGFLVEFIKRLQETMKASLDATLKASLLSGIYSSISMTIQECTKNLISIDKQICDELMTCSIQLIQHDSDLVYEEALLAFAALCENIKGHFVPYVANDALQEVLSRSIADAVHFPDLCRVGSGAIGDVYRYGEEEMKMPQLQPFTDKVVSCLLHNMVNEELDISVKCHVIDALADIGLSYGPEWKRYTAQVMEYCLQAGCFPLPPDADEYIVTHFNEVRVSIVDVCRSTLMACTHSEQDLASYQSLLLDIFRFLEILSVDTRCSEDVTHSCVRFLTELIGAGVLRTCPQNAVKVMQDIQKNGAKAQDGEARRDAAKLAQLMK